MSAIVSTIAGNEMMHPGPRVPSAGLALFVLTALFLARSETPFAQPSKDELLARTARYVEGYWEQISLFDCKETVTREKAEKTGKVNFKQKLEYDYLALPKLRDKNLTVEEVRLPLQKNAGKITPPPLLETNGFPTLLLIFHPRYQANYTFEIEEGAKDKSVSIRFAHISGADSTSAVMIQGTAYALELHGTASIDENSGAIQRISASLINPMSDLNIENFSADVSYELFHLPFESEYRWLPSKAIIQVQSKLQRWRNIHQYSAYKRFTVEAEGVIAK
jgi:hypothetical protein